MKRITGTYTVDVPDDTNDVECYEIWSEIHGQDRQWPDDNQIKIEILPDGTPDPTRPQ